MIWSLIMTRRTLHCWVQFGETLFILREKGIYLQIKQNQILLTYNIKEQLWKR